MMEDSAHALDIKAVNTQRETSYREQDLREEEGERVSRWKKVRL